METLKKITVNFDDGSVNPIFEMLYDDKLNCKTMSVAVRFIYFGGKYVYDFWNDVVHQPEMFIPYGYMENGTCKKLFSYYSNIESTEAYKLGCIINEVKEDALVQYLQRKTNHMFVHLTDPVMFPILKLVVPGIMPLSKDIMKKIRSENI